MKLQGVKRGDYREERGMGQERGLEEHQGQIRTGRQKNKKGMRE